MANATTHRVVAGLTMLGLAANHEQATGKSTAMPVVAGCLASLLGTLPDLIEPATNPNHRQFFHSIVFATAVGYGIYKAYKWQPESQLEQIIRGLILITGGAYLAHLAMDFTTAKGLPLVGKT